MSPFEFSSVGKIVFGRGKVAQLGELARGLGTVALVVHNGDDPGRGGAVDRAAASLEAAGVKVHYHRQRGEPKIADVDAGLAAARQHGCDLIIGLGGGSAIDAAKAVAGLLTNGGAAIDYMEVIGKGQKITKAAAPWIAVPTTAGTGAEVTKNAVIGSPEHQVKASLRSEYLLARIALVDPELQLGLPPAVIAASGMDALCQLIESLVSTGSQPVTHALSLQGFRLIAGNLVRSYRDPANIQLKEPVALAALLSGITLGNAGLGAVHGFAAPLGARFPIPHGVICARLLAPVVGANLNALRDAPVIPDAMEYYAVLGRILSFRDDMMRGSATNALLDFLTSLVRSLQIPNLSEYGLREEHVPSIVELARKTSSMKYNPVVLSDEALAGVLRAAM